MKAVIYRGTNTVTGKVYIGQTTRGLAYRKAGHLARFRLGERDHKLYQSMRKHGPDAFRWDVVCCALKPEWLDELETAIIKQEGSYMRGYNMTCGGDTVSDETRQKLSRIFKGRKVTWAHKAVATRRARGNLSHPQEKGDRNLLAKSYLVQCPDGSQVVVKGLRAFCRERGLDHGTMFAVLSGKQSHHKGYVPRRFNDYPAREYA